MQKKKKVPDFRHGENIHSDREIFPHLNYDISLSITKNRHIKYKINP